jgi:mannose-6-phosphate isomerase-like protein (cupin superfamily)
LSKLQGRVIRRPASDEYYFEEGCYILEYLNDPVDPALSIARARVPPGVCTRWHRLRNATERYLVQSGEGEVEINEEPARRVVAGDVVLIPPMARQRIRNSGAGELIFLALCTPRFEPGDYLDDE